VTQGVENMKKFVNELHAFQLMIYEYLKQKVSEDGSNLIDTLVEIEEAYESVPERYHETYSNLNHIERIEVIHFFTKYIMRKNQ
jgi:hypothetical protein